MTIVAGEPTFYDYGNAPEVLIERNAVAGWELTECGLVRLFIVKKVQSKPILDHTDLMTPDDMDIIARCFQEIAAAARRQVAQKHAAQTPSIVPNRIAH